MDQDKVLEDIAQAVWNAGADQYNQWESLGQDEKDELITDARAIQKKVKKLEKRVRDINIGKSKWNENTWVKKTNSH